MKNKGEKKKKNGIRQTRNALPIIASDRDLLSAFEQKEKMKTNPPHPSQAPSQKPSQAQINRHGVPVLDCVSGDTEFKDDSDNIVQLLEESIKKGKGKPLKKSKPMSLKRRLKRYPPVEIQLDLHGYTAVAAEIKTRFFIQNCKQQGFFTLRIIVGKGLHSDLGPVLPDVVEDVVRKMKKQNVVIFYEWDKKKKSKSGSILVYLKQFDPFD